MSSSRAFSIVVSLVSLVTVALPVSAQRGDGERRRGGERREAGALALEHFRVEEVAGEGEAGASVRALVYLPAGYGDAANAARRYPWAVWLHGRNESAEKFHAAGGAAALDTLRGQGAIPDLIFVSLDVGRSPLYLDGTRDGDQEKVVVEVLPRLMAARYRVLEGRAARALMGVSMGGFGALKIAMRHPEVYATVAAHSAALMPADPTALSGRRGEMVQRMIQMSGLGEVLGDPIDPAKWAAEMPLALARDLDAERLRGLAIYFDAGTDDRYGFAPGNEELHRVLEEREVAHRFELVEGGGHSWGSGSLQQQLRTSLRFVGERLGGAAAAPADGAGRKG